MHAIRWIREDPKSFDDALRRRGLAPQAQSILDLDTQRRTIQTELQGLLNRRNEAS